MKRKFIFFLLLISSLFNTSSTPLIDKYDSTYEHIDLMIGETHNTNIYPNYNTLETGQSPDSEISFNGISFSAQENIQSFNLDFFDDIYISPGETKTVTNLPVWPGDYESTLYIYLDDGSSFQDHEVEARVRMNTEYGESCEFDAELYAFDTNNHQIDTSDVISVKADYGWSNGGGIYVDLNAEYVKLMFSFYSSNCGLSTTAYIDVEIQIDGGSEPESPPSYCGDGYVDPGEECDGGSNCTSSCTLKPEEVYINFWAEDDYLNQGDCTYINWEVSNAADVYYEGKWVDHYGYEYVCPARTTEYELQALGEDGDWKLRTVTIYVEEEDTPEPYYPPPEFAFLADEYQITSGECVYIYWDARDAESIWFEGGSVSDNGNEFVCPTATTTYELEVIGFDDNYYSDTLTITVDEETGEPVTVPTEPEPEPVEISFFPDGSQISEGECTWLNWLVEGADDITLQGKSVGLQGKENVCPTETTQYDLVVIDNDGRKRTESVTVKVDKNDCSGDDGFILIVTDSERLNIYTGDTDTWGEVQTKLEKYYSSSADSCMGKPFFLDITKIRAGNRTSTSFDFVDKAIENFIKDKGISSPAAIAIIGGPWVIPHENSTGLEFYNGPRDDAYADFDHDKNKSPDTVITRLPDGRTKELLINYIDALSRGNEPPDGAILVVDMKTSAHKLNQYPSLATHSNKSNRLFLEDFVALRTTKDVVHLMTPPMSKNHYYGYNQYAQMIRTDDKYNVNKYISTDIDAAIPEAGVDQFLNRKHIVFGGFQTTKNGYYLSSTPINQTGNLFDDPVMESPFSYQEAADLPEGAHVFSLAGRSALLQTNDSFDDADFIPKSALNAGVHHFIGRTSTHPIFSTQEFDFLGQTWWDLKLDIGAGRFAAEFFRRDSLDPATSFWQAKIAMYGQGDLAARSFLYLGLPEKRSRGFGKFVQTLYDSDPRPQIISEPPLSAESCGSGNEDDCDGDQLSDSKEYYLASMYAPFLIPDEDEDTLPIYRPHGNKDPFGVFWQVSPAKHAGKEGAWITYVFSYTEDNGIHDIDIDFGDCMKCVDHLGIPTCDCSKNPFSGDFYSWGNAACCGKKTVALPLIIADFIDPIHPGDELADAARCIFIEVSVDLFTDIGILNINPNQFFLGHPGDNEAFRVFIADDGSDDWELTHINWKRHHEGYDHDGMLQTIAEAENDGLEFYKNTGHPLLYVSEDKHATYPTKKICEGYEMEFIDRCVISFEHCAGHSDYNNDTPIKTQIRKEFNVGEREGFIETYDGKTQQRFNLRQKLDPVFPDEYAWKIYQEHFCGNIHTKGGFFDEDCGGPMGKLWYPEYLEGTTIEF